MTPIDPAKVSESIAAMGKHVGYRVVQEGDRWRGFYRDGRRYRSKTWDTEALATAWASGKATAGESRVAIPRVAARLDTAEAAKLYLRAADLRRRSPSHLANMKHTLTMLAAAVPDLAAVDAHRQTTHTGIHSQVTLVRGCLVIKKSTLLLSSRPLTC